MTYDVRFTEPAEKDIEEYVAVLAAESRQAGKIWLDGLDELRSQISANPNMFSLAPESFTYGTVWRSANLFSHRVVFRVMESERVVLILRVYHGARRPLRPGDINEPK